MSLFFQRPWVLLSLLALVPLVQMWQRTPTSLTPPRSRGALVLRVLSIVCLILALAGAQIKQASDRLSVLFLLDRSLSTGADSEAWQLDFVNRSLEGKDPRYEHGVVLFGRDTGLDLPSGNHSSAKLTKFTSVVDRSSSQLTSALRFAATAFGSDSSRRLVVLSDAQSTESGVSEELKTLSEAGIEVWMVPQPQSTGKEVLLKRLQTPSQVSLNEPFLLRLVLESQGVKQCQVLLTENGKPHQKLTLNLRDGPNLFLLPQRKTKPGPTAYVARLVAEEDSTPQNNKGESLTLVEGEQKVIVLRQEDGPGSLVPLLREAGIESVALRPSELPKEIGAWRDVSCLVIEDVDSLSWDMRLQQAINILVREGGMGIAMLGSDSTFGVGAYQKTPIEDLLPVNLSIRRPKDQPLSALVQCIDKSGSMTGDPIRKAREAAIAAAQTLSERDLVGVVGFDSAARWVVPLAPKGDASELVAGVASLRAGGGTNLYPALDHALKNLENAKTPLKHIIVLSDGAVADGNYPKLLREANRHKITVSAVAFGQGADIRFLENLTTLGKGRLFRSPETGAGSNLAQIFIRDTVLATGAGIQKKPTDVRPSATGNTSPLLSGLDFQASPKIAGYNMASSKGGTAQTLLLTPKSDPILAIGQAGLGRSMAWLSDLGGIWSREWDDTPGAGGLSLLETLLLRGVRSAIPDATVSLNTRGNALNITPKQLGDLSLLEYSLKSRRPIKGPVKLVTISSKGTAQEQTVHPESPYQITGEIRANDPGSGLVIAQDRDGQILARSNYSIPLAPEFLHIGTDEAKMRAWTKVNGARFNPSPESIFETPSLPTTSRQPLSRDLARGVLLLLLLEIAVRRLPLPKRRASASKSKLSKQKPKAPSSLSRLKRTKANHQKKTKLSPDREITISRTRKAKSKEPVEGASVESNKKPESAAESTLAKLKRARGKKKP